MANIVIYVKTKSNTGLAESCKLVRRIVENFDTVSFIYEWEVESFIKPAELWERIRDIVSKEVESGNIVLIRENAAVFGQSTTAHQVEDKKFIHGHCTVQDDDLYHVSTDEEHLMTLCGKPVFIVARGLINATCEKCREIWHGINPVDV